MCTHHGSYARLHQNDDSHFQSNIYKTLITWLYIMIHVVLWQDIRESFHPTFYTTMIWWIFKDVQGWWGSIFCWCFMKKSNTELEIKLYTYLFWWCCHNAKENRKNFCFCCVRKTLKCVDETRKVFPANLDLLFWLCRKTYAHRQILYNIERAWLKRVQLCGTKVCFHWNDL